MIYLSLASSIRIDHVMSQDIERWLSIRQNMEIAIFFGGKRICLSSDEFLALVVVESAEEKKIFVSPPPAEGKENLFFIGAD